MKNVLFLFMIMKSCFPWCFHIQFLKTRHDAKWGVRERICALMLMMMMLFFSCSSWKMAWNFPPLSRLFTVYKQQQCSYNFQNGLTQSKLQSSSWSFTIFLRSSQPLWFRLRQWSHHLKHCVVCTQRMVNLKWKWASPLCSLSMRNEKSCENIHFPLNFPSEECSACFLCMLFQLLSFLANSQNTPLFAPQFYPFSTSSELLSGDDDV